MSLHNMFQFVNAIVIKVSTREECSPCNLSLQQVADKHYSLDSEDDFCSGS